MTTSIVGLGEDAVLVKQKLSPQAYAKILWEPKPRHANCPDGALCPVYFDNLIDLSWVDWRSTNRQRRAERQRR